MPISRGTPDGGWVQEVSKIARGRAAGGWITETTGGGITVPATGVSATGTVGSISGGISYVASGVSAVGAAGTLTAGLGLGLTGVSAMGGVGSVVYVPLSSGGGGGLASRVIGSSVIRRLH